MTQVVNILSKLGAQDCTHVAHLVDSYDVPDCDAVCGSKCSNDVSEPCEAIQS
jgi:hypothetical protein